MRSSDSHGDPRVADMSSEGPGSSGGSLHFSGVTDMLLGGLQRKETSAPLHPTDIDAAQPCSVGAAFDAVMQSASDESRSADINSERTRKVKSSQLVQDSVCPGFVQSNGVTSSAHYLGVKYQGGLVQELQQSGRSQEEMDLSSCGPKGMEGQSLSMVIEVSKQRGVWGEFAEITSCSDATPRRASPAAQTSSIQPTHSSIFYPYGLEHLPPVLLHYVTLGGWRTVAGGWDYFSHRRLGDGEVSGHTVRWLHNARPRDRFAFIISPVERRDKTSRDTLRNKLRKYFFGTPPAFADCGRQSTFRCVPRADCEESMENSSALPPLPLRGLFQKKIGGAMSGSCASSKAEDHSTVGVEVVEVKHEDVTAMDYNPRLVSSRFAIEAKVVNVYFFPTLEGALEYYNCPGDQYLMDQQEQRGITNVLPCVGVRRHKYAGCTESCTGLSRARSHASVSTAAAPPEMSAGEGRWIHATRQEPSMRYAEHSAALDDCGRCDCRQQQNTTNDFPRDDGWVGTSLTPQCSFGTRQTSQQTVVTSVQTDPTVSTGEGNVLHESAEKFHFLPQIAPTIRSRLMPELTAVHFDTIVTLYSEDPNFNAVLREVLMPEPGTHPYTASLREQRRMLAMYELGMPTWTVFLASTGLPYRRALRLTFVGLVNIWPIISLFVGLYDLYKHLPQMKRFFSSTFEPLLIWLEEHVTVRVSMMITYTVSVCVTVASALVSFLTQFYPLEIASYPLSIIVFLLKHPSRLLLDTLLAFVSIVASLVKLLWITVKILFAGPFLLVSNFASLEIGCFGVGGGGGAVFPAAVEGTSLTLKWWRAWQEFWVTVAAPVKNLAKAWYDSIVHVCVSATRREASIRRWYTAKLHGITLLTEEVHEAVEPSLVTLWGRTRVFVIPLVCLVCLLYWFFLPYVSTLVREEISALTNLMSGNIGSTQMEYGEGTVSIPGRAEEKAPLEVDKREWSSMFELSQLYNGDIYHLAVECLTESNAGWFLLWAIVETLVYKW
ncbi:hypothetical protein, conserved [Trypanosoma brucei gambiense DAL972]|uniref:Uncharacterized protein n=1 Tax=Trypanosoma brucei gambiense (strain MHOM/CI/86/DAL972) TaxID=679716 RepID=C9ZNZ3_TRYB9|nr:hypothetical protein, conserved [Trypanosoma brucei gambiense DAL972]CBH11121.1 hypothetical protein, conserved [Trypanosoma brucei gambiense DAL972]|eukprot:XP_011773408.1 hypothetical protein, conserved [Trypanosoma brucei gambiense DAL972]